MSCTYCISEGHSRLFLQLSTIGRCEYGKTCALLVQLFEQTAQRYQELITARMNNRSQQHSMEDIAILEGGLMLGLKHTAHNFKAFFWALQSNVGSINFNFCNHIVTLLHLVHHAVTIVAKP